MDGFGPSIKAGSNGFPVFYLTQVLLHLFKAVFLYHGQQQILQVVLGY